MENFDLVKIENAREKYRPDKIKILLIAEAPPDAIERFFYFEDVKDKDFLFLGVIEAIYPVRKREYISSGRKSEIKKSILDLLKADGIYLIDFSDRPITMMGNVTFESLVPSILQRITNIVSEETKIILIKANVYDTLFPVLFGEGFHISDKRIPFPSSGQQGRFQNEFKAAMSST